MVLARGGAESAWACLAMLASYHGRETTLSDVRSASNSGDSADPSGRALVALASRLDLRVRPLINDPNQTRRLAFPVLARLGESHYVILRGRNGHKYVANDPVFGKRAVTQADIDQAELFEVVPTSEFSARKAERPGTRISDLWSRLIGARRALLQVVVLSIVLQVLAFVAPLQMQIVIDDGILGGSEYILVLVLVAFIAITILQALAEGCRSWILQVANQFITFQVTGNLVGHLLMLPNDFFEKRHLGDILSRMSSARSIQEIITRGMISAVLDGVMALAAAIILLVYSIQLAMIILVSLAALVLLNLVTFPALRRRSEEEIAQRADEQSLLMESVRASTIIKLMGGEAEREIAWRNRMASALNASTSVARVTISVTFWRSIIVGIQTAIVVFLGASLVLKGEGFSIGMLVAFLAYRTTFTDRALAFIAQAQQFRLIGMHLRRLSDIVETPADPIDGYRGDLSGPIRMTDVSFRYEGNGRLVLDRLNLEIPAGEFLAITGSSGGGKTTLLKVMLGLQPPESGEVRFGPKVADAETWRGWRSRVGVVSQDDKLLSGTLAENIAFFDPDLDLDRVVAAATAAQVHDEVARMPAGYNSLIGDMGSALSGGQRQRVLLARALYRQPDVLVLDEGTANIDPQTELAIGGVIRSLSITRIVVAHRPALIELADRVLVMENGALRLVRPLPDGARRARSRPVPR